MPRTIGIYEITPGENGDIAAFWADTGTVEPSALLEFPVQVERTDRLNDPAVREFFQLLSQRNVVIQQAGYGHPEQDVDIFIPYPRTEDMQALDRLLTLLTLRFSRPAGPARTVLFPTPLEKDDFVRFFLGMLMGARLTADGEVDSI